MTFSGVMESMIIIWIILNIEVILFRGNKHNEGIEKYVRAEKSFVLPTIIWYRWNILENTWASFKVWFRTLFTHLYLPTLHCLIALYASVQQKNTYDREKSKSIILKCSGKLKVDWILNAFLDMANFWGCKETGNSKFHSTFILFSLE